ncbi:MAG: Fe-S cluster assembly protein SufD [Gammaproteobacteria bacterium]|nr:Fe-S cluster assembly protein SufD [Gammaproteobacteria bacterium]
MNMSETGRQWLHNLITQGQILPDQQLDWLDQNRQAAWQQMQSFELPDRKQEAWRYTSIDRLIKYNFLHTSELSEILPGTEIGEWILPDNSSYRLVFINGHCVPRLCNIQGLPRNVAIGCLRASMSTDGEVIRHYLSNPLFKQSSSTARDLFAALNTAYMDDGLFVHIPKNAALDRPIEVLHLNLAMDNELLILPRHLVVIDEGASATLIERYVSQGNHAYFSNNACDIFVNGNARLSHYRIQDESAQSHHLGRVNILQGADSNYKGVYLALGGSWSRCDIDARFSGKGAHCDIIGLYTVNAKQLTDFHLNVLHNHAHCSSRENFRGIIAGSGRAVFDGRIVVEKHAQKTDAQLTNKNLLLSLDAEVDTKPQLEIYADDVKCSHGTTVGQIDPKQVFYIRSRGIDEAMAKKMLCLGFAGEIFDQLDLPEVRSFVEQRVQNNLFAPQGQDVH